jgi:LCP family protein required for cell wall assembly
MKGRLKRKLKYLLVFVIIFTLFAAVSPSSLDAGTSAQVQEFVSRFYEQCLNRQPDQSGLNVWVGSLLDGSKTGEDVASGFILSDEFISRNCDDRTFVTILYKAFFNREPDSYGFNEWLSRLSSGSSRESVLNGFLHSTEFTNLCSGYGIVPYAGSSTTSYASGGMDGFCGGNKVNFIIWGDDSAHDRAGGRVSGRTDINIFVHLNLDTRKAYIVTIPRDTWFNGRKINGYHAIGGNAAALNAFEQFTGTKMDFYAITDFDGFIPLIDYFGGVTTTVEENVADGFSGCYLNAGVHHINGTQSLALSRARHGRSLYGGGAYARERQSAMLLVDLLLQKRSMVNSRNLANFLNTIGQFVWTNMSASQAAKILPVLLSMNRNDVTITTFRSWPQWFGNSSAVGYDVTEKNQFFNHIVSQ